MSADPCRGAESLMQPYLDRVLTEAEVTRIDVHLQECTYCSDRYVFEPESLVAIAIYSLIGWGLASLVRVLTRGSVSEN